MAGRAVHVTQPPNPDKRRWGPLASPKQRSSKFGSRALGRDVVVDVKLPSPHAVASDNHEGAGRHFSDPDGLSMAKMFISTWMMENQRYFTLTFVYVSHSSLSSAPSPPRRMSQAKHPGFLSANSAPVLSSTNTFLSGPSDGVSTSNTQSPSASPPSIAPAPAPDVGAPGTSDTTKHSAMLEKVNRMKNAMIDSIGIPAIAMWKDESLMVPNKAASALMQQVTDPISYESHDLFKQFKFFTDDFGRQLEPDEYPFVQICRSRQSFRGRRVGVIDSKSQQKRFDVSGETIVDQRTGEFLAGIVFLKDVAEYAEIVTGNFEVNQQFQLICDTIPQMVYLTVEALQLGQLD